MVAVTHGVFMKFLDGDGRVIRVRNMGRDEPR